MSNAPAPSREKTEMFATLLRPRQARLRAVRRDRNSFPMTYGFESPGLRFASNGERVAVHGCCEEYHFVAGPASTHSARPLPQNHTLQDAQRMD
jgi:hypothetical protein